MFLDDDVTFTKEHFLRLLDFGYDNVSLVASNTRNYSDNSVVTGAYRDLYGKNIEDAFLSLQAAVVNSQNSLLGFPPRIYCEDWMFMLPFILFEKPNLGRQCSLAEIFAI
jgi:hypothetical protein